MKKFLKNIRYIFEYISYILIVNFLKILGLENSTILCSYLARKIGPFLNVTKVAYKNIQTYFPNKTIDTEETINNLWDNFGHYIGEFPFINHLSEDEIKERVKITGFEHVKKFQQDQRPFLMFLGHFANWDFAIRRINDIYPKFGVVYRKANNPYVDQKILQTRAASLGKSIKMIAKGRDGVKDLIRSIKNGYSIAMLVDQKMNDGIEVPFFGQPAMTAPAIARLSIQYNYPIIPCQLVRLKNSYFEVILHPEIQYTKTQNIEEDCYNIMLQINQQLEKWISQKPAQWFWFHNRWKK